MQEHSPFDRRSHFTETMLSRLGPRDTAFFCSIASCGVQDGAPFVRLFNDDLLFGYTDWTTTYYEPHFSECRTSFESLGLEEKCFGAAFDALCFYHYENCSTLEFLKRSKLIHRRKSVLDIGCRCGHFMVKAAPSMQEGLFVGIDPTEFGQREFTRHAAANGLDNVRFFRALVADRDGVDTVFHQNSEGELYSGLFRETVAEGDEVVVDSDSHGQTVTMKARTVDAIVDELGLDEVGLVSMQINGGEVLAVQGMDRLLEASRPNLFFTAFQSRRGEAPPKEFLREFLEPRGYVALLDHGVDIVFSHFSSLPK